MSRPKQLHARTHLGFLTQCGVDAARVPTTANDAAVTCPGCKAALAELGK